MEELQKYVSEEQDPKTVEKILESSKGIIMPNEEIIYISSQKKPAVNLFPDSIILTDKRLILCKPKHLGLSMDFTDYNWRDIKTPKLKESLLGSEFSFYNANDEPVSINYIPKIQARKLHALSQNQLENHRLENKTQHINILDDDKVTVPLETSDITLPKELLEKENTSGLSKDELIEKLQKYKKLLDDGLITGEEYNNLKSQIINKI